MGKGAAMGREARRRRVARLLAPGLAAGEEVLGNGAAWFAAVPSGRWLVFVGRHYQLVALTDRRLLVFAGRSRSRGSASLFEAPLDALRLTRVRGARPLLQVVVTTDDDRSCVLEFRPRERALGRALVDALGSDARTPAAS
jgi:hypothetical protein